MVRAANSQYAKSTAFPLPKPVFFGRVYGDEDHLVSRIAPLTSMEKNKFSHGMRKRSHPNRAHRWATRFEFAIDSRLRDIHHAVTLIPGHFLAIIAMVGPPT